MIRFRGVAFRVLTAFLLLGGQEAGRALAQEAGQGANAAELTDRFSERVAQALHLDESRAERLRSTLQRSREERQGLAARRRSLFAELSSAGSPSSWRRWSGRASCGSGSASFSKRDSAARTCAETTRSLGTAGRLPLPSSGLFPTGHRPGHRRERATDRSRPVTAAARSSRLDGRWAPAGAFSRRAARSRCPSAVHQVTTAVGGARPDGGRRPRVRSRSP